MFKPSKNPKIEELLKSSTNRRLNTDALPREPKLCVWCMEPLTGRKYMWCSKPCQDSAWAHINPQKEGGLQFLLVKQNFKCAGCQFDYKPYVDDSIAYLNRNGYKTNPDTVPTELNGKLMKILKHKVPTAHHPEVDHILAISKGGQALGFDNHQILCFTCHKSKTKVDLSGKRTKRNKT